MFLISFIWEHGAIGIAAARVVLLYSDSELTLQLELLASSFSLLPDACIRELLECWKRFSFCWNFPLLDLSAGIELRCRGKFLFFRLFASSSSSSNRYLERSCCCWSVVRGLSSAKTKDFVEFWVFFLLASEDDFASI